MLVVNAAKIPRRIYKSFKQFYLGYFHFIICLKINMVKDKFKEART